MRTAILILSLVILVVVFLKEIGLPDNGLWVEERKACNSLLVVLCIAEIVLCSISLIYAAL